MFHININLSKVLLFLFFVVVFLLTRQIPFSNLSILSNVSLLFMMFYMRNLRKDSLYFIYGILLLIAYSLIMENNVSNVIRFAVILFFVQAAYYIRIPEKCLKILVYTALIQCVLILLFEFYLMFFANFTQARAIRLFFLSKEWGDVYSFNRFFYKIQLKGNAILPYVYMLLYSTKEIFDRKTKYLKILFFLAIICTGQFAFYLSLFLFHILKYIIFSRDILSRIKRLYLLAFVGFLSSGALLSYIHNVIEMKADMSNATRIDQIQVLMQDMCLTPLHFLFGTGLGHTLSIKTSLRDYTDLLYYELQSVYFLNQLGFLFFFIWIFYILYLTCKRILYKDLLLIYALYILYAITNPYIFDTNHVVVILTLCSLSDYRRKNYLKR